MPEESESEEIIIGGVRMRLTTYAPTTWITASFAGDWFADAIAEARSTGGRHSRRREILFAACCAESYLVEWVRDSVLMRRSPSKHVYAKLADYFQSGKRVGLAEKWKDIPKRLHAEGLIPNVPDFGGTDGEGWRKLIEYRNGLVHARASRPVSDGVPESERPNPTNAILSELPAGWATRLVVERIRRLHEAAGTPPPDWLISP